MMGRMMGAGIQPFRDRALPPSWFQELVAALVGSSRLFDQPAGCRGRCGADGRDFNHPARDVQRQRQLRDGLKPHPPLQELRIVLQTCRETLGRAGRSTSRRLADGAAGYGHDVTRAGYCDGR